MLTPAQTSLLTDQYELAMASSYLARGMNELAVFELFARHLPARRRWLLAAGLGPALAIVREMEFGEEALYYLRALGFGRCRGSRRGRRRPTVTLELELVAFLRLIGGSASPRRLLIAGRQKLHGDLVAALALPTVRRLPGRRA